MPAESGVPPNRYARAHRPPGAHQAANRFHASSPGASYPPADARDVDAWLTGRASQNIWIGNDCDSDLPAGMICGIG